jgi:hypothetical protein
VKDPESNGYQASPVRPDSGIFLHRIPCHDRSIEEFEAKWSGVRVDGREVFAYGAEVLRMANADIFQIEHLYASVESAE